jgi:hypothetical protein
MALALELSALERNDSKLLTLTDVSTGWNTGGDPDFTSIAIRSNNTYSLTIDITLNTPTGVVIYDQIDGYLLGDGPFAVQSDMVFPISATSLQINSSPLGTIDTLLPDGIWDVTYKLQHYVTGSWVDVATKSVSILVYGQIKTKVYNKLRKVPKWSECANGYRDISEASFYYTYLQSIEKSAFVARKAELLQMLETLERLLLNGSNYPW